MVTRQLWFDSHLLGERAGKQAKAAAEQLGVEAHEAILRLGDAIAEVSAAVAQRYYLRAAAVWEGLGEAAFRRWADDGYEFLGGDAPQRESALAYFSLPAKIAVAVGGDTIAHWCRLGRELSALGRKLGAGFLEGTAPLLDRVDLAHLQAWADTGRELNRHDGWRGELAARAFFGAAPVALPVLAVDELAAWGGLARRLHPAARESDVFGALPDGFHLLRGDDRQHLFAITYAAAAISPKDGWFVYRELPAAVRRLHPPIRSKLLALLAQAARGAAAELRDIVAVSAALTQDIPRAHRQAALDLGIRAATAFPLGGIALLRSLPTAYEDAAPDAVERWVERGLQIAADNSEAGKAYFALESRTSVQVLHASSTAAVLNDVQGLLRKYVQMISGRPASIRGVSGSRLRPELEEFPLEDEIALPLKVDRFATHEDNCRLYRFLAAQVAGRRVHATYAAKRPAEEGRSLYDFLIDPEKPMVLEDLFLLAEGYRVAHALGREFPGLAFEQVDLAHAVLDRVDPNDPPPPAILFDLALAAALAQRPVARLPRWLQPFVSVTGPLLVPLSLPSATVDDALTVAEALTEELAKRGEVRGEATPNELAFERLTGEAIYDMFTDDDGPSVQGSGPSAKADTPTPAEREALDMPMQLDDEVEEEPSGTGAPMSPEELQALIDAGADLRLKQGRGEEAEGLGLYISDLIGKLPQDQIQQMQRLLGDTSRGDKATARRWLDRRAEGATFYYDEWDYHIGDYRERWCRLLEIPVSGDSGEFFQQTLVDHAELIPEVRRQFQKIRPEMYRVVRGLEDGEDFDLNAVIDARVDRRAGRSPSPRLYTARQREERDVATLFLIDLSASTDEPFEKVHPEEVEEDTLSAFRAPMGAPRKKQRRIIDVTKEALVIMAAALEEIGDAYAIYGFSGHGRKNVEFYMVKGFNEGLSGVVRGRIGAMEPKRSTRMGAALRHATEKLAAVTARSRHMILLSDGFPQDFDYGQDRRSNVYGLRDTTVALREAEASGVQPFCITVDKAGHDYLREMCDTTRYMVIDDIASLPRELPKIYQRVVTT